MVGPASPVDRRVFFGLLALGLASTLASCSSDPTSVGPGLSSGGAGGAPGGPPGWDEAVPFEQSQTVAGPTRVLTRAPAGSANRIALTVDDGYSDEVVAGYVDFVVRTGIHLTFSPNGLYAHAWAPHARQLTPLIERGQVQIMNHTFHHRDLRKLTDAQIRSELERNDEWVHTTFGTTTRPYYRPPFGFHTERIDGIAAELGYHNTVLWSGSLSDSKQVTPAFLLAQARRYLQPGVIMLGHANHPAVLGQFNQITNLIKQRNLRPVTLTELFGPTS